MKSEKILRLRPASAALRMTERACGRCAQDDRGKTKELTTMAIMERLEECDRMCRAITDARVSDAAQHDLTGLLHRDLMLSLIHI